jgi:hypothetical protein
MRAVVLGVAVIAVLGGCGAQTHVVPLKTMTPSQASKLVKSFTPGCNAPGRVLIRHVEPDAHGRGGWSEWCVEPAKAYHVVSLDLRCPTGTRLKIDFQRHTAECPRNAMGPPISITLRSHTLHTRTTCPRGWKTTTVGTRVECSAISKLK